MAGWDKGRATIDALIDSGELDGYPLPDPRPRRNSSGHVHTSIPRVSC